MGKKSSFVIFTKIFVMDPATENVSAENICKIIILESDQRRRLFHPKLHENFLERVARHKKTSGLKRCLFGVADPEDTKRMLEEQYLLDQKRFHAKFGFDIETIEHLERSRDDVKENIENDKNGQNKETKTTGCNVFGENVKNLGRKILKARRKMCFSKLQANQSQQYITDFYQARKNNALPLEVKSTKQLTNKSKSVENC